MKRRSAVYLRFSSDKQSMTSLEDQLRVCTQHINANGDVLLPEHIFSDAAVSGASEAGREGLQKLKALIARQPREIDQLVVADLSRLSRDLHDMAGMDKELRFYGIELISVGDGISGSGANAKMSIVLKSLMNELYITDLGKKTREGLVGQAHRGFSTGGRIFGFGTTRTVIPGLDNKTNAKPYIIEEQAQVVRRAFELASQGHPIEKIVRLLNADNAPCPDPGQRENRPKGWTYSSMRSVLHNPKYTGTWVFNQSTFVKDPLTGKRKRRFHPEEAWTVFERPELAIIDKGLFQRVQDVLAARGARYERAESGRLNGSKPGATRASYLLSGLVVCGGCGSPLTIYGGKRSDDGKKVYRGYRCPKAHRSGPTLCTNTLSISKHKLEGALFDALDATLFTEEAVTCFETEFRRAYEEALRDEGRQHRVAELEHALAVADQKIGRLVDALEAGESSAVASRLKEAEARRVVLQKELDAALVKPSKVTPELASGTVRAALGELRRLLKADPVGSKERLRQLFGGELKLTPKAIPADAGKGKTRSTWFYEVSGFAFLQNLLIPLSRGDQDGLPVVAGARNGDLLSTRWP